jgi:hypothetical protein
MNDLVKSFYIFKTPLLISILAVLSLFSPLDMIAQSDPYVKGLVKDESGQVVPYATVALYSQDQDSTLVQGDATGMNGKFQISAPSGIYFLQITFLSYQKKTISDIDLSAGNRDLGTIELNPGAVDLE